MISRIWGSRNRRERREGKESVIVPVAEKLFRSFPPVLLRSLQPTLHFLCSQLRRFTNFLFKIPRHAIGMNLSGGGQSSAVSFMLVGGRRREREQGKELRSILSVLIRLVLENRSKKAISGITNCFNLSSCIVSFARIIIKLCDHFPSKFHFSMELCVALSCPFFFFFFQEFSFLFKRI